MPQERGQQRVFTLEEANALVPKIREMVERQVERRGEIERRLADLARLTGAPPEGVVEKPDDPPAVRAMKRELVGKLHDYQRGWNEIESLGVVVKDARGGLLDFYSRVDGKLVFLCWKYPETAITHYHELEAGYQGRRAIEGAVKTRLYN